MPTYEKLTLVTCAALGGALIAAESLPELLEQNVIIGNSQQSALPCLNEEHYAPKLLPLADVLACLTELMNRSQSLEEQNSLTFLKSSLRNSGATHFWVA